MLIKGYSRARGQDYGSLTQGLEDCDGEDAANVDEYIKTADKESELDCDRAETTEYLTDDFITHLEVQNLMAAGMRKSTSHQNDFVLRGLGGHAN